jgi:hypothetical protein
MIVHGIKKYYLLLILSNVVVNCFCQNFNGWAYVRTFEPSDSSFEAIGSANFGSSIAFSKSNSLLAVGGKKNDFNKGEVWIIMNDNPSTDWSNIGYQASNPFNVNNTYFGTDIAFSIDNNTVAVGGFGDSGNIGAAWIFKKQTTNDNHWDWWNAQQKLTPINPVGTPGFGAPIKFSPDNSTLAIGGSGDNNDQGAVWLYSKIGNNWSNSVKITPINPTGSASFGNSIAFSSDSNYLAIGGLDDDGNKGAVWLFDKYVNGTWDTEAAVKVIRPTTTQQLSFGASIAFSDDGNNLAIGAPCYQDITLKGGVYIYNKDVNGNWNWNTPKQTIQPNELGTMNFGTAIAFSKDSNNLIIGGPAYSVNKGAVWIYTKSGDLWANPQIITQTNSGSFGVSIAITDDNKFCAIGGSTSNGYIGKVWIYKNLNSEATTALTPSAASRSSSSITDAAKWALSFFDDKK